jgi:hypothetical protein
MSTLTPYIQNSIGSNSQSNWARKINKTHLNQKKEAKLSLFPGDMILRKSQFPPTKTKKK